MRVAPTAAIVVASITAAAAAVGQLTERPLEGALTHPAIAYATRATSDPIAELRGRIESGETRLTFADDSGYLRSVLDALRVPIESQMLVMSKTGVQALHTEPGNPRAIFFNDAVTVGYIRGAPLLEFAVQDQEQGIVLYTLDQKPQAHPTFERPSSCLRCHQAYTTLHVPGLLARSVFVAPDGLPLAQFGSYDADDRTPFRRRWGGWYVTGTHGSMVHMGNAIVADHANVDSMISDRTLNRTSLDGLFDPRGYPSAHSDIAALMVFQHQAHMANLITRVGWEARIAEYEHRLEPNAATLAGAVRELVDYALFTEEAPLGAAIAGTSGFAEQFSAQGPRDSRGRSLRQLDLRTRLLRYPCSYMVYSAAFGHLPSAVRQAVFRRMREILSGTDTSPKYARLTGADRRAVVEILHDTVPDFDERSTPQRLVEAR